MEKLLSTPDYKVLITNGRTSENGNPIAARALVSMAKDSDGIRKNAANCLDLADNAASRRQRRRRTGCKAVPANGTGMVRLGDRIRLARWAPHTE
jgi:hypothetical protein